MKIPVNLLAKTFCDRLDAGMSGLAVSGAMVLASFGTFDVALAEPSGWEKGTRIAISADGNPGADPDDIGATPMTLAILAKAGLQDDLVHYDFNNWLEYKKIPADQNDMWVGAMGGQARWGFAADRFFDASIDPEGAIASLTNQINQSTAEDPLYVIAAGPVELLYEAMVRADQAAIAHVTIVSHSGYNDYYKARLWHRNLNDIRALGTQPQFRQIPNQNPGLRTKGDFASWHWFRDHADPNVRWIYSRIEASNKPDVSDAGMVSWLIGADGGDEETSIQELQAFLGDQAIPTNGGSAEATLPTPAGVQPEVPLPVTESIFAEVDGKLVIEAESVPLTGSWILDQTEAGYTGDGYIRYMPANIHVIHSQSRDVLIYKLRITNPGKYRMAMKASHRGAPERDKWNDCWTLLGIDIMPWGSVRKTYHSVTNEAFKEGVGFTFGTSYDNYGVIAKNEGHFSKPLHHLEAGDHYFFVVGRSGGYRLDKIHFFKEGVDGFQDDAEPTTPVLPGS